MIESLAWLEFNRELGLPLIFRACQCVDILFSFPFSKAAFVYLFAALRDT